MKTVFKNYIEKKLIGSYKDVALYLMEKAPDYFWTIPASTSGKYHPVTDLGEGGLVRHSLMVARVMEDLIRKEKDSCDDDLFSMLIIASLFHDVMKCGEQTEDFITEHEHPIYSAGFVYRNGIQVHSLLSQSWFATVAHMIERHMGRWTTSTHSDTILEAPDNKLSDMLHTADYIASRKYCLYDEEYFNNL